MLYKIGALYQLMKVSLVTRKADSSSTVVLIQTAFIPANLAGHLVRIAVAWNMVSSDAWRDFAVFVATTTTAQIAARLLMGGLGDALHPLKLAVGWTVLSGIASTAVVLLLCFDDPPSSLWFLGAGSVLAFAQGAREPLASTIMPKIAAAETISALIPIRTAMNTGAQIGGPLLAGAAVGTLGVEMTLAIGCVLFALGALATTALLGTYTRLWNACPESSADSKKSYTRLLMSPITGLRRYVSIPSERAMAAICFAINFALPAFFLLLVPTIVQDRNLPPSAIGMLDAAFALGILFSSIFVVRRSTQRLGRTATMALGVLMCGLSIIATALCPYRYAMAALFFGGMGLIMLNINIMTVRALATPKTHIGSFCASAAFITSLAIPLGNWVVAGAVMRFGHTAVAVATGMAVASCAGLVGLIPAWRAMSRLTPAELKDYYLYQYPAAFK